MDVPAAAGWKQIHLVTKACRGILAVRGHEILQVVFVNVPRSHRQALVLGWQHDLRDCTQGRTTLFHVTTLGNFPVEVQEGDTLGQRNGEEVRGRGWTGRAHRGIKYVVVCSK